MVSAPGRKFAPGLRFQCFSYQPMEQKPVMKKAVYALMLWLAALPVFADEAVAVAPQVDADPTALIVFAVVFIGMIAGFAGYIWLKERAKRGATK